MTPQIWGAKKPSYKSVKLNNHASIYTMDRGKEVAMSEQFDPIDSLVSEIRSNVGFLNKLMFPKISLIVGAVGILIIVSVILLK